MAMTSDSETDCGLCTSASGSEENCLRQRTRESRGHTRGDADSRRPGHRPPETGSHFDSLVATPDASPRREYTLAFFCLSPPLSLRRSIALIEPDPLSDTREPGLESGTRTGPYEP